MVRFFPTPCFCSVLFCFSFPFVFCFNVFPPTLQVQILSMLFRTFFYNNLAYLSASASGTSTCTSHSNDPRPHAFICFFQRISFCSASALAWKVCPYLTDFYRPFRTHLMWYQLLKTCLILIFQTVLSVSKKRKRLKIPIWILLCSVAPLRRSNVINENEHFSYAFWHLYFFKNVYPCISPNFFSSVCTNFHLLIKVIHIFGHICTQSFIYIIYIFQAYGLSFNRFTQFLLYENI